MQQKAENSRQKAVILIVVIVLIALAALPVCVFFRTRNEFYSLYY